MAGRNCPDCGFWMACGPCSIKYDGANEKPMEERRLEIHSRPMDNPGYDLETVELGR
jgi:hypothetical protein